jgi:Cdc6-like AAA superfamily ATPase
MLFDEWLKEESNALEYLQNKKLPEVYVAFLKKDQEYNKEVNLASFTQMAKEHLFSLGLTNPTFRPRKKGSVEKEVVDKALEDKFLDIVDSMGWEDKFEFLKGSIKQMHLGRINSIFVYGNPGTGKSYDIINTLNELDSDYKLYKGNVIKGTDDLFRLLYNNRGDSKSNKILVFDDGDKAIQNTDINIWKTILENVKEREITYVDVKRNKNKNISDIPPVFSFFSSVIFVSNSPKLNSAIASRSVVLNMKLSNEETLKKVESTIKEFLPDVEMQIKRDALEFAKEISNGIKNVDYRSVEKIIIARQINPKDWKKYALWMLAS